MASRKSSSGSHSNIADDAAVMLDFIELSLSRKSQPSPLKRDKNNGKPQLKHWESAPAGALLTSKEKNLSTTMIEIDISKSPKRKRRSFENAQLWTPEAISQNELNIQASPSAFSASPNVQDFRTPSPMIGKPLLAASESANMEEPRSPALLIEIGDTASSRIPTARLNFDDDVDPEQDHKAVTAPPNRKGEIEPADSLSAEYSIVRSQAQEDEQSSGHTDSYTNVSKCQNNNRTPPSSEAQPALITTPTSIKITNFRPHSPVTPQMSPVIKDGDRSLVNLLLPNDRRSSISASPSPPGKQTSSAPGSPDQRARNTNGVHATLRSFDALESGSNSASKLPNGHSPVSVDMRALGSVDPPANAHHHPQAMISRQDLQFIGTQAAHSWQGLLCFLMWLVCLCISLVALAVTSLPRGGHYSSAGTYTLIALWVLVCLVHLMVAVARIIYWRRSIDITEVDGIKANPTLTILQKLKHLKNSTQGLQV